MRKYFVLIIYACVMVQFGNVTGNKLRQLGMRMGLVEQRLNENDADIYEMQFTMNKLNSSLEETKKMCGLKAKQFTQDDAAGKSTVSGQPHEEPRNIGTIARAFQSEKTWIRRQLSMLQGFRRSPNEDLNKQAIHAIEQRAKTVDEKIKNLEALTTSFRNSLQSEIQTSLKNMAALQTTIMGFINASNDERDSKIATLNDEVRTNMLQFEQRLTELELNKYQLLVQPKTMVPTCETGWKHYDGHCYQLRSTKATFDEAVKACVKDNAHLVEIYSELEDIFVDDIVNGNSVWLGSKTKETWMTGTAMNYKNWWQFEKFHAFSGGGPYTYKTYDGKWNTSPTRRQRFQFVCKKAQ